MSTTGSLSVDEQEATAVHEAARDENEVLRGILRKVKTPMWWARLGYPDRADYWTEDERALLREILG